MIRRYRWITHDGKSALEHVVIASKALGKPLPPGAQVHHVDGDGLNNVNSNLVICPSKDYHKLLHVRERALDACGNPNWRKCHYCQRWDDPAKMSPVRLRGEVARYDHAECHREYQRNLLRRRKAIIA